MKLRFLTLLTTCLICPAALGQNIQPPTPASSASSLSARVEHQLSRIEQSEATENRPRMDERELQQSITEVVHTLPYSPHVLSLQKQGQQLYFALMKAKSPDEAKRLTAQLSAVQDQVNQDPSYLATMNALEARLFAPEPRLERTPSAAQSNALKAFPYAELRPGDVLLMENRSSSGFFKFMDDKYARVFTHAAIYLGDVGFTSHLHGYSYEALNPVQGVRVTYFDNNWNRPGLHVAIGHVNISSIRSLITAVRAVNTFGNGQTQYHLSPPWDKRFYQLGPVKFLYCSQLVWVPYSQSGIDLDSNNVNYRLWFDANNWWDPFADSTCKAAVFPDELRSSTNITWYYDQVNPN